MTPNDPPRKAMAYMTGKCSDGDDTCATICGIGKTHTNTCREGKIGITFTGFVKFSFSAGKQG